MTMHQTITMNGLDVKAAQETIEALKADSGLAKFQFRARNKWIDGGENRSTIRDFYGAGEEDTSRTEDFEFVNGEPPVLLGRNEGANPVEFLLHGLAGCVTTTLILHATMRGIVIVSSFAIRARANLLDGLVRQKVETTTGSAQNGFCQKGSIRAKIGG